MDERTCSIDGCPKSGPLTRGWCRMHYTRWKRHGDPTKTVQTFRALCEISNCEKPNACRGLCSAHSEERKRRARGVLPRLPRGTCAVEGCAQPHESRGYCQGHYQRLMNGADVDGSPLRVYNDSTIRNSDGHKQCRLCMEWLPESSFSAELKTNDGLFWHCRPCRADKRRDASYGLKPGQFNKMLAEQGGCCAICKSPDPVGSNWAVDHDHRCCPKRQSSCGNCVRGLLCSRCNFAIGQLLDNPESMRAAARYVEAHALVLANV